MDKCAHRFDDVACLECGTPIAPVLLANLARLFAAIGDKGRCRGCDAPVVWVKHKTGRTGIYDLDGTSHFVTCPKREEFKRAQA